MPVATSIASAGGGAPPAATVCATVVCSDWASASPCGNKRCSDSPTSVNCSAMPTSRCNSPPATADQESLAAATRLRANAVTAGS